MILKSWISSWERAIIRGLDLGSSAEYGSRTQFMDLFNNLMAQTVMFKQAGVVVVATVVSRDEFKP